MKKSIEKLLCLSVYLLFATTVLFSQKISTNDAAFDHRLSELLSFSTPVISVKEAFQMKDKIIFLDAREKNEYEVSHIPGALHIGYDHPDRSLIDQLDKNGKFIIYCSVGYRSEKMGEHLIKEGFKHIFNLYGSVFQWVNEGYPVVTKENKRTNTVHTYNKKWSKWVSNRQIKKVWK